MRSATSHPKEAGPNSRKACAWVAHARAASSWRRAQNAVRPALAIFAVSVRDSFSAVVNDRLRLMTAVADRFASSVPAGVASLWVFPGGYFGYSAARNRWSELSATTHLAIERDIRTVARRFPVPSLIAVGVDGYATRHDNYPTQQVCVVERRQSGIEISRITRGESPLAERQFKIGSARAAFFVCGEFTGSYTANNGPFWTDRERVNHYLDDLPSQLRDCNVLVDLAHHKVSGSVSGVCGPRMVHRRQMERFSTRGIAVLTHHHAGDFANGRPHFKHQSNWIVFRGGDWLPAADVEEFPAGTEVVPT